MADRLLNKDTRLAAEHILKIYKSLVLTPSGMSEIDLTIVFDMALRETFAAKEVGRLGGLVSEMRIERARADTEFAALEERHAANRAILKARTEEMNKAHHKLNRVKQIQDVYKKLHNEASNKLDLDEEGGGKWEGEDLDEIEMHSEVFGSAYDNIRLALADLTPMTMEELKDIGEYVWIYWEDPDKEKSRMFCVKTVEIKDRIKLHGYGSDELLECRMEELFKVHTCA